MDNSPRLSGDDWQDLANQLLELRYGPGEYQQVPDNRAGDAGIEGFTIREGHAYQAYGPEEPLSTDKRYKKLRTKMTNDIKKFIDNRQILTKLFGDVSISRWILLVPHFDDKRIVEHASKLTEKVLAENLPYVNEQDFRLIVKSESDFPIELEELLRRGLTDVDIVVPDATEESILEWQSSHGPEVATLDDKAMRIPTLDTELKRKRFRRRMLKHYLEGQNAREELHQNHPKLYEDVRHLKSQKEKYLQTETMLASAPNNQVLTDTINDIKNSLENEVGGLSPGTAQALAYESAADWLIRCPLDFPEIQDD